MKEFSVTSVSTVDSTITLDVIVSCLLVSGTNIHTLLIENTPIQASSIACIAYSKTMESLTLRKNGYKDADAIVIAEALLSSESSLHSLDLSSNDLTDLGGQYLERLLEKNSTIQALCLDNNQGMSPDEYAKLSAKLVRRTASSA